MHFFLALALTCLASGLGFFDNDKNPIAAFLFVWLLSYATLNCAEWLMAKYASKSNSPG